jgi:hypothetical protein
VVANRERGAAVSISTVMALPLTFLADRTGTTLQPAHPTPVAQPARRGLPGHDVPPRRGRFCRGRRGGYRAEAVRPRMGDTGGGVSGEWGFGTKPKSAASAPSEDVFCGAHFSSDRFARHCGDEPSTNWNARNARNTRVTKSLTMARRPTPTTTTKRSSTLPWRPSSGRGRR